MGTRDALNLPDATVAPPPPLLFFSLPPLLFLPASPCFKAYMITKFQCGKHKQAIPETSFTGLCLYVFSFVYKFLTHLEELVEKA